MTKLKVVPTTIDGRHMLGDSRLDYFLNSMLYVTLDLGEYESRSYINHELRKHHGSVPALEITNLYDGWITELIADNQIAIAEGRIMLGSKELDRAAMTYVFSWNLKSFVGRSDGTINLQHFQYYVTFAKLNIDSVVIKKELVFFD